MHVFCALFSNLATAYSTPRSHKYRPISNVVISDAPSARFGFVPRYQVLVCPLSNVRRIDFYRIRRSCTKYNTDYRNYYYCCCC